MKKLSIFSVTMLTTLALLSSCKKDDDPSPSGPVDNTSDYVHFNSQDRIILASPLSGNGNFTITTLFKSEATDVSYRRLFGFTSYELDVVDYGGTLYYYDGSWRATTATNLRDGNWHHLAITKGSVDFKIYLDGVLVEDKTAPTFSFSGDLAIGGKVNGFNEGWLGCVDDFRVYGVEHSREDIWTNMEIAADTADADLLLDYDFNQLLSDTSATDNSINDRTGTFEGEIGTHDGPDFKQLSSSNTVNMPKGEYIICDGNDIVRVNSPISDATTFTIETKFKTTQNNASYNRFIGHDGNELEVAVRNGDVIYYDGAWRTTTGTGVDDDEWHHLALTVNDTVLTIYLDGDTIFTRTANLNFTFSGIKMAFGGRTNTGESFTGEIDDSRVWSTARTQNEIVSSINSKLSGTESGLLLLFNYDEDVISQTVFDATGNNNGLRGTTANIESYDPEYGLDVPADVVIQ